MLVNSSRSSTDSSVSSSHSATNIPLAFDHSINNPSTIVWTQTLESITLQIRIVSHHYYPYLDKKIN